MSGSGRVGVGIIGAGMISDTYLENLSSFPDVEVVVVGDLVLDRARAQADKHGVADAGTPDQVVRHPGVEIVVNLTIPAVHASISSWALEAGKHVWSEKPISIDRASGQALVEQAEAAGLLLGIAPDTVLGPGLQAARAAIARGDIGVPQSAQTVIQYPGPDLFHPNPEFLFAAGAGPLFDIGPYYLTTLVHLFGPVARVSAFGSTSRETRTIQAGDRAGTTFPVEVPTLVAALAEFDSGAVSSSTFSFQSSLVRMGYVEIAGSEGTLLLPDPNYFDGEVTITHAPSFSAIAEPPVWTTVHAPAVEGRTPGRGLGVLDMARALRHGGRHVADGALGYHVLDVMMAIDDATASKAVVEVDSGVGPVPMVADGFDPYERTV